MAKNARHQTNDCIDKHDRGNRAVSEHIITNGNFEIDQVLDQKITFGCFPWRFQGGEAAFCRAVAFLDA